MKEKYTKPGFVIEYFTMTDAIASNCSPIGSMAGVPTHSDIESCQYKLYGELYWSSNCEEDGDTLEEMCYNGPSGNVQIFAS